MCCQKFFKMGCLASKEVDESSSNVFKVTNVDDYGNQVGSGLLEIKNFELILYQKNKSPIMWPLKTLRRYGFDADHFSFECGRRCRTGPGIYAFRCQKAEQLFNLLQSRIQVRESQENDLLENSMNPTNLSSHRNSLPLGDSALRRAPPNKFSSQFKTGRLSSVGSTSGSLGPISPMSTTSAPVVMDTGVPSINLPDVPEGSPTSQIYINDDVITASMKRKLGDTRSEATVEPVSPLVERPYVNSFFDPNNVMAADKWKKSANEIKIVLVEDDKSHSSPEVDNGHLYLSILPNIEESPVAEPEDIERNKHRIDIFNGNTGEFGGGSLHRISENPTLPTSPRAVKSLNYIVLDLEQTGDPPKSPTSPNPSENGKRLSGGYTAIDFQKTVALSHSIHPDSDMDRDSCRKTRHSSNAFPHERHGSSVSD